ncbi:class I SAM-dependent methyltransferase [Methanococcoides methylutens]|uniref:class I SAM-dependent methyltransferase n=1 Tax=Methanococcoides methylutens TaxID=2226 RepID=UPI004044FACC
MKNKEQLSPEVIYEMVANVGFRKHFHLGGLEATRELVESCHIDREKYVLDVGCASGKTACYIAKRYGCRVVGVDILERMIDRANERARREGVEDRVSFRVADVQDIPFEDNLFDVVIGEFITGLLDDKERGVNEYIRVTKPGGYVGLNEATWIKTPPPAELIEYLSRTFGVKGEILTSDGWKEMLEGSGLREIVVRNYKARALSNKWDNLKDVLRVWHKMLYLYVRNPAFRSFIKETLSIPKNLLEYFGYGIYVGRK